MPVISTIKNELIARRAFEHARATYTIKSSNKFHPNSPAKQLRWAQAVPGVGYLRMDRDDGFLPTSQEYGDRARQEGIGNCHELAVIASNYLKAHGVSDVGLVGILPPGDHQFAVIGLNKADVNKPFAQWGDHVYIIDPWANILCRAKDFPFAWKQKMRKWKSDNKKIINGPETAKQRNWVWMDPTTETWLNQMETCKRDYLTY